MNREIIRSKLVTVALLITGLACLTGQAADTDSALANTPQAKKAVIAMLGSCRKEFSQQVADKSIDEIDHWAEAQENSPALPVSSEFKKSQCYATHETWEKLVQRNEWAVATPAKDSNRMPASANPGTVDSAPQNAVTPGAAPANSAPATR